MGSHQRFPHQVVILGIAVLDQRPLHGLLMGIGRDIDLVHGPGIQTGVVHDCGQGGGCGIEVLDLLRIVAHFPDVLRQFNGFLQGGAGMAGHKIRYKVLIHAVLLIQCEILVHKLIVHRVPGFSHPVQNCIGHMLRGHFQLAGNVELHQFLEEGVLLVRQQIVKPDAAADEYLLHPGNLPQLAKQGDVIRVVGFHVLAGGGIEALPSAAGTLGQLLVTGRVAEVGSGAAHIVDVALEILVLYHQLRFPEDGFMAAGLDDSSLVEGQGTEGAGTEAAPIGNQAELHFLNGRHTTCLGITGMPGPHIGQVVDCIHFLGGQRLLRGILHHIFLAVGLSQPLGGEGVAVAVLNLKGFRILSLVGLYLLKGGQDDGGQAFIQRFGAERGAVDVGNVFCLHACVQRIRQFHNGLFAHAVHEDVRLAVQQNGALHAFAPVIVVAQAAKAGFDAADENGHILVGLADQIAVDDGGVVGALAHNTAGGEGIGFPLVLGNGVVVHHGVHIAAGHQEA